MEVVAVVIDQGEGSAVNKRTHIGEEAKDLPKHGRFEGMCRVLHISVCLHDNTLQVLLCHSGTCQVGCLLGLPKCVGCDRVFFTVSMLRKQLICYQRHYTHHSSRP